MPNLLLGSAGTCKPFAQRPGGPLDDASGGSQMSVLRIPKPIQIGLVTQEPIRLEGLASIFEGPAESGHGELLPVKGELQDLLHKPTLEYLIIDLNTAAQGLEALEAIRRQRPDIRLIVIGPDSDDEVVIESIMAGARAYLDLTASPETVRLAIQEVMAGSIWAPRRLLSKLIDRLLNKRDTSLTSDDPHLTDRERQVLELILLAQSNREIARKLGIEERTVKAHVGRLMRKSGVENRIELSMRALSRARKQGAGKRREGPEPSQSQE
jgi:DNA-binding NarL/FixJ family response regulator